MPRRAASVTQADISRAIRALRAAGYADVRVVMRDGGVVVEPAKPERPRDPDDVDTEDAGAAPLILL